MEQKANPPTEANNNTGSEQKKTRHNLLRIVILLLVVLAVAGLFLWKNLGDKTNNTEGSGNNFQSTEFDLDATEDFDLDEILSHNMPVVIDFGADSCTPCIEMAPVLQELNQELRGKAVVKFVDVRKNSNAGQAVPLELIPTQFFFNADGSPYVPADEKAAAKKGFIMYTRRDTGEHVFTVHQGYMSKDELLTVLKEMGME